MNKQLQRLQDLDHWTEINNLRSIYIKFPSEYFPWTVTVFTKFVNLWIHAWNPFFEASVRVLVVLPRLSRHSRMTALLENVPITKTWHSYRVTGELGGCSTAVTLRSARYLLSNYSRCAGVFPCSRNQPFCVESILRGLCRSSCRFATAFSALENDCSFRKRSNHENRA
jgi:hypothetical protein